MLNLGTLRRPIRNAASIAINTKGTKAQSRTESPANITGPLRFIGDAGPLLLGLA